MKSEPIFNGFLDPNAALTRHLRVLNGLLLAVSSTLVESADAAMLEQQENFAAGLLLTERGLQHLYDSVEQHLHHINVCSENMTTYLIDIPKDGDPASIASALQASFRDVAGVVGVISKHL